MKTEKTYLTAQYFLNHKLEPDEVKRQIREFAAKGYQGVFPHARAGMLTPYMSKDWWDIIDVIVKECRETGMKVQIWDEDYYPSGIAGGRIAWEHPELASRTLKFASGTFENCDDIELDFNKGYLLKAFALELDDAGKCLEAIDITEYCGTRRQDWGERYIKHAMYSPLLAMSGNPHWRTSFNDNRFAVCWKPAKKARYMIVGVTVELNFNRTSLMDPGTTKAMLDSTYEEYFKRYGKDFGDLIEGVFFDEPSNGAELYPWSANFEKEFFKDHSYSIIETLAHLAYDIDEKSPLVRMNFRETQHRLMTSNYLEQSREWCETRKLIFRGHLTRTEWLSLNAAWWPNEIRCYKYVDVPCCDPLGKAFGFKDTAAYHTGLKVVSSAAHIFGKKLAGSDCLAVIGDEVSIQDLKGQLDYQMALGINFFVSHGYSYSIEGPRKDEVPPSIFYQHSEWDYMKYLSEHVVNVCSRLSEAVPVCNILMLYPSTSLAVQQKPSAEVWPMKADSWILLEDEKKIHSLVDDMLSAQRDFDFIDEITITEGIPEKYSVIVLPYVKFIPEETANALYKYIAKGGRVILVNDVPLVLSEKMEKLNTKGMELINGSPVNSLPAIADIKGAGSNDIFVARYLENNKNLFFLYNRSRNIFHGTCEAVPVEVQPLSGLMVDEKYMTEKMGDKIIDLNSDWTVEFEENQLAMTFMQVYENDDIASADYKEGKHYDLMMRGKNPASKDSAKVLYRYRFTSSGNISNAKIVMDESAVSGNWKVFVNGTPVEKWTKKRFYDCNNIYADIKLKQGGSPLVNLIDIVTEGGEVKEMPYLYGNFKCSYRHSHKSFPDLTAAGKTCEAGILSDWADWGYPTYSGKAVYTKSFEVANAGTYFLDLGRVEDIAEISIDNEPSVVLPWAPYTHKVKLATGKHTLKITVSNAPGNMFRNSALPAGLLGPVKILTMRE